MLNRVVGAFRREPQLSVVAIIGLIIAYLSLSPTVMLFYGSFRSKPLGVPGDFTLAHYISAYTDPLTYQLLFNSFIFAGGSAVLATFLAATLAWISIRTNAPFRKFFELTAIVPNIFPHSTQRTSADLCGSECPPGVSIFSSFNTHFNRSAAVSDLGTGRLFG